MARDIEKEMWQICEACRVAVGRLYNEMADLRMYEPVVTPLEELTVVQDYREKAVERFHWLDWERVHEEFDRVYAKVIKSHVDDALPYI